MKTLTRVICSVLFTSFFLLTGFSFTACFAQNNLLKMKIGTYDSRVVFIAYTRSDYFVQQQMKSREEGNEILQSNDTVKKIEAFYKVMTEQYLMHQRGFSNGSAASILALVKDKLPLVAKDAGVISIVSKWELTFAGPDIEIIDLTMPIAQLYSPTGDFEKITADLVKMDPIPLEELPMDEVIEMWKQFETVYLGVK
jgi:hypothetical protein